MAAIATVRASIASDVYALAANLRDGDRREVEALGLDVRGGIRRCYRDAILRRTYLVDGEVAAMSGLCGAMLGDIGQPYLMTAPAAELVPVSFVKHARNAVNEMLRYRIRLEGVVAADYARACRLLEVLGFKLGAPVPLGPHGTLFRSFVRMRGDVT